MKNILSIGRAKEVFDWSAQFSLNDIYGDYLELAV
jgi:hypothetical protein